MKTKINAMLVNAAILTLFILPGFSFANTQVPPGISEKEETPGEGLRKGWEVGKYKGWNKEDLLKLKKENPERFKETVKEKTEQIRKRLEELKQGDPERYHRVMQKVRQRRLVGLERLRKEDPEKFKGLMQKRRENFQQRLEKLKTENPEEYKRIMEHKKKMQEMRRLRKGYPRRFQEDLEENPGLHRGLNK